MPRPLCDGVRAVPGPARKVSSPAFSRLRNGVRADSGALAEDCALCPRGWGGADGGSGRRAPEVAVLSLGVAAISGTSDPLSPAACCAAKCLQEMLKLGTQPPTSKPQLLCQMVSSKTSAYLTTKENILCSSFTLLISPLCALRRSLLSVIGQKNSRNSTAK